MRIFIFGPSLFCLIVIVNLPPQQTFYTVHMDDFLVNGETIGIPSKVYNTPCIVGKMFVTFEGLLISYPYV